LLFFCVQGMPETHWEGGAPPLFCALFRSSPRRFCARSGTLRQLLGMASPISGGLPKREKCAMLHYIAPSAGSAPDRMHRAGDARDTLGGRSPSSLLPDLWRSVARQTCRRRSNSLSWHSARGQYTFPKNRDSEFSKISFNFPQIKFSKS
jgi:hypothetical protein